MKELVIYIRNVLLCEEMKGNSERDQLNTTPTPAGFCTPPVAPALLDRLDSFALCYAEWVSFMFSIMDVHCTLGGFAVVVFSNI